MNIESLSYSHKASRWNLQTVAFSQLSLLVGLSGVGKTRILKGLQNLASVASGGGLDGVTWKILFKADDKPYVWHGRFESLGYSFRDIITQDNVERPGHPKKPRILEEEIWMEGNLIASRKAEEVEFNGAKVPKLSADESLVKLFSEEELIKPISDGFKKVQFIEPDNSEFPLFYDDDDSLDSFNTDDEIRDSTSALSTKLRRAFELKTDLFSEFEQRYIEIFPFVTNVLVTSMEGDDVPRFFKDTRLIHIKERGVDEPIPVFRMSSGMVKTLYHLAAVLFSRRGSVFLIDEFENSLGANCVDLVTDFIIEASVDKQFIMTSHHPYVINHVKTDFWSVVERKGSDVRVKSAKDAGVGSSRHESYDQLMNTILYQS